MKKESGEKFNPIYTKPDDPISDAYNAYADKLERVKHIKPYRGQGEAATARKAKLDERQQEMVRGRLKREGLAQDVREENRQRALEKLSSNLGGNIEKAKSKDPLAEALHKQVLENVDARTDEILSKKNKLWKNVVETYFFGGENAVREELFDPVRNGKSLTREMLERDMPLQKQLRAVFMGDVKKRTFESFMAAVPAEQDYVHELKRVIALGELDRKIKTYSKNDEDSSGYDSVEISSGEDVKGQLGELDGEGDLPIENKFDVSDVSGAEAEPLNPFAELQGSKTAKEKPSVPRRVNVNVVNRGSERPKPGAGTEKSQLQNVASMPSKSFVPKGVLAELGQINRGFNRNKNQQPVVGEIYNSEKFSLDVEKDLLKHAQDEYVQAYRAYYTKETAQMLDSQVLAAKPPMFAIRSAAKNLKRLYAEMVRVKEEISEHDEKQEITESLRKSDLVKPKASGINPELQRVAAGSDEREKQKKAQEVEKEWFANSRQVQASAQVDRLVEQLKGAKTVQEGINTIGEKRAEGIQKKLQEIEGYFADKKIDAGKTIKQYLLGEEIRGWFKGEQKRLQQEYKDLYNNPVYQKYLTK